MRFRELRRVLQQIVLVGLPAAHAGCFPGGDCVETKQRSFEIPIPADPPLQFSIDRCRIDPAACPALCDLAIQRANATYNYTNCVVTFEPDRAVVDATFYEYSGGPDCPVDGRRPAGLVAPAPGRASDLAGAWLAHAAWLEAASVYAFAHLARELEHHGAPAALIRGAHAAARDEVHHTALMSWLALRYGARPAPAVVVLPATRPLVELAVENAAEGCVRETWGAVMALWQSHTARDPAVRGTFRVIARDEARHAALAWAIDRWAAPRLDADAVARVTAARARAAHELRAEHDSVAITAIGLPAGRDLRNLVTRADGAIWSGGIS